MVKDTIYDVCLVGSGAGAGPIAYTLSKAGFKVLVLEKGPWITTKQFTKDEISVIRRSVYTPNLKDEPQVIEEKNDAGQWIAKSNYDTGNSFWNGNCVGGSSNFMSGYFHRLKPQDFKLLSTYGPIAGANIADWPIDYDDLEPYYTQVEQRVGVSGKVVPHRFQDPRSTSDFPYPPLQENIISQWIDAAANQLEIDVIPIPRAILSQPTADRQACYYSNYCGSYGCSSDAKGSSRAALLNDALHTGHCTILPNAKVFHLETNGQGRIIRAHYHTANGTTQQVSAKIFVVAAQAIETCRLLLMSKNKDCPNGLSNNHGQVGKNLIFSAGGVGSGQFLYDELDPQQAAALKQPGVFVNRSLYHWYEIEDAAFTHPIKGGTVDFLFEHANAISKLMRQKYNQDGTLRFGPDLKQQAKDYFTTQRKLKFEVFADWLPNDDCFVTLDPEVTDKWNDPVARIRIGYHEHDLTVGHFLAKKAEMVLETMGAKHIQSSISGNPPSNLVAGGCRFGNNPETAVLNKECRSHEIDNLYITDASFMPTGGSVTYTWTIYANAFRVADIILNRLNTQS